MAESEYLDFELLGMSASGKTKIWDVVAKGEGFCLGAVSWYSPWRKYCFRPSAGTVYDPGCLREIADFCNNQTLLHRNNKILEGPDREVAPARVNEGEDYGRWFEE